METTLKLASGESFEIPGNLLRSILAEANVKPYSVGNQSFGKQGEELPTNIEDYATGSPIVALQIAEKLIGGNDIERGVLFLGVYAERKALDLSSLGKHDEGLRLLADSLRLGHGVLAYCTADLIRQYAASLARQSEEAFHMCAMLGSIRALSVIENDVADVLNIAATIWEPDLLNWIRILQKDLPTLSGVAKEGRQPEQIVLTQLVNDLEDLKGLTKGAFSRKVMQRPKLIGELADSWLQMVQKDILLAKSPNSEIPHEESSSEKAQKLVGDIEQCLRTLIAKEYEKQFGSSWVQHIASKHKPMYERWIRYIQKDHLAFKAYAQYSPQILDYALLEDLRDLVMAQWQLFYRTFDFHLANRNKAVFHEKVTQIIQVRNVLAHHRAAPENELLRARVLCTDILLALDKASGSSEENGS